MDCQCNRCHAAVEGVPPSKRARRLMVLFGIALFVLAPLCGGIVGLSLIAVPGIIAMGLAIGPLARMATEWTCPRCKHVVHTPEHIPAGHFTWRARHLAW